MDDEVAYGEEGVDAASANRGEEHRRHEGGRASHQHAGQEPSHPPSRHTTHAQPRPQPTPACLPKSCGPPLSSSTFPWILPAHLSCPAEKRILQGLLCQSIGCNRIYQRAEECILWPANISLPCKKAAVLWECCRSVQKRGRGAEEEGIVCDSQKRMNVSGRGYQWKIGLTMAGMDAGSTTGQQPSCSLRQPLSVY